MVHRVVFDTNVLVSALRSRLGASYKLLSLVDTGLFELVISVPLIMEYESVAKRQSRQFGLTYEDIDDILDYICRVGLQREIYFLWRPVLRDPKDDLVLELAVESECDYLITHNLRDFKGSENFELMVVTPRRFLEIIGQLK
ncbi:MAG TPA: putative toxin-antitoxin system toxin component, PIN family [Woeseiaceae bacterium]|nr:putative toxin-antitoxin system toxin component, PIN family [Woeseiaceae bacterium]